MKAVPAILLFLLVAGAGLEANAYVQHERQVPPPQKDDYSSPFLDQLRRIFDRFRGLNLDRDFKMARPIRCPDLTAGEGEWRDVAFFNGNRNVEDWYRTSLDEVKSDLAVYVFRGVCGGQQATLQVTARFPVDESVAAYQEGRIRRQEVDIRVNAPVSAVFNPQTQAYTFDLPNLFRVPDENGGSGYALGPHRLRDGPITDVTSRWECKRLTTDDPAYQFLICRITLIHRDPVAIDNDRRITSYSFGSSAYSILSNGP